MKKRIGIITLIVAVAAIIAVPLIARPHMRAHAGGFGFAGHGGEHGGGFGMHILGRIEHVKEELDLSDQQVDQLKTIFRETRDLNEPYREQLQGGMHEVVTTLLADPNNTAAAQAIIDQRAAAEKAMKQNMLSAASKALGVLTPEQRTKLAQLIGEHHARRAAHRR